jgi:hypothetical protein
MRHNHPPEAPATSRTQATLSTANKKLNKHFGDLLMSKEANTFRLLCINPQGIKPHNDWQDFRRFCTEMRNLDVDTFCLSGTDVEFKDSWKKCDYTMQHDFCIFFLSITLGHGRLLYQHLLSKDAFSIGRFE